MGLDQMMASFLLLRAAPGTHVATRPRRLWPCPLGASVSGA